MSHNIDSFNKVVAFSLAKAYEQFPCVCSISFDEMIKLVEYGCNGIDTTDTAKKEFIKNCIYWLDEEVELLRVSEGFNNKLDIKLTIKGLQHLKKIPKSLEQNIGNILLSNTKQYLKDGMTKGINEAISFGIDSLMENLQ